MGNRLTGMIGSLVMLCFGVISFYRFYTTGLIFFLLMVFRDVLAAWFLFTRNEKNSDYSSKVNAGIAYLSSAIPLFYFNGMTNSVTLITFASIISVAGFLLSTLALIELGKSFGVSPANRGQIFTGVYRITNHPMYFGYVISEFSFLILNPANIIIYIVSITLYFYRSKREELVFEEM